MCAYDPPPTISTNFSLRTHVVAVAAPPPLRSQQATIRRRRHSASGISNVPQ